MQIDSLLKNNLDTPDPSKIRAFVLLSETVVPEKFVPALISRIKAVNDEAKLPFFCLIDALLKQGRPALVEPLKQRVLHHSDNMLKALPWHVPEHIAAYQALLHSWLEEGILGESTSEVKRQLAFYLKRPPPAQPGVKRITEREIRERLQEAGLREAADFHTKEGVQERLLVPGEEGDDVGEDAEADDDEEMEHQGPARKVVHTPCSYLEPAGAVAECVAALYSGGRMCQETGRRLPPSVDTATHKDEMFKLRTRDETLQRCRLFYRDADEWVGIKHSRYGRHALGYGGTEHLSCEEVDATAPAPNTAYKAGGGGGGGGGGTKRKREALMKDPSPSEDTFCFTCHEKFDKELINSEWFLTECVESTERHPEKLYKTVTVLKHTDCVDT